MLPCRHRNVPLKMRRAVMAFYVNYLKAQTPFDEEVLLEKLPESMRLALMKEMYKEVTAPVPFLQGLSDDILAEIYFLMKPMTVPPEQLICSDDDSSQDFYIVTSGSVDVFCKLNDDPDAHFLRSLRPGEFFGECGVLGLTGHQSKHIHYRAQPLASAELIFMNRVGLAKLMVSDDHRPTELAENIAKFVYERNMNRDPSDTGAEATIFNQTLVGFGRLELKRIYCLSSCLLFSCFLIAFAFCCFCFGLPQTFPWNYRHKICDSYKGSHFPRLWKRLARSRRSEVDTRVWPSCWRILWMSRQPQ
eukprot:SAG31_NODE_3126_length_4646_cov_6.852210_3_plen_304_part_00